MLVGTLRVVFPITQAAGIDPVFFGVFMVLMWRDLADQPADRHDPVRDPGRARRSSINDVFQGTLPFFAAMVVMTGVLIHFPTIATVLPNLMFGR